MAFEVISFSPTPTWGRYYKTLHTFFGIRDKFRMLYYVSLKQREITMIAKLHLIEGETNKEIIVTLFLLVLKLRIRIF